jgi:hypothetical protein
MHPIDDDEPDPRLLWRWAARATRPWAGWLFIGFGVLLVLLGYLGVSGEAIVEKQIPYLVSGGIGGVLACVLGAYFLGTEELRKDSGRLDRLEQMVEELHAALLQRADAPAPAPVTAEATPTLVAVAGGSTFHRTGCPLADGKETTQLTPAALADGSLAACPLCAPVPEPA